MKIVPIICASLLLFTLAQRTEAAQAASHEAKPPASTQTNSLLTALGAPPPIFLCSISVNCQCFGGPQTISCEGTTTCTHVIVNWHNALDCDGFIYPCPGPGNC